MKLLIVEDETALNKVLTMRLKHEEYEVDSCVDGETALFNVQTKQYDGIILDIMLPKIDGLTILKQMRTEKNATPVLLLTAKDSIEDRVRGLDCGANDYLIKPFAYEELLARIRVLTRKAVKEEKKEFSYKGLVVNCNTHQVSRDGIEIALSSKEFALLEYMIRNQGIVLSKEKIEQNVWQDEFEGESNVIKVYIRYLRKKIDDNFDKKLIGTVRNYGYVLRAEDEK